MINIASLLLGQNGIWGDLPGISDEGVALFGEILGVYKTLRDDITSAGPVVYGRPGEALEVYEKINKKNGRGMVAVFTNQNGEYSYRLSSYSAENATVFGSVNMIRSDDAIILRCEMDAPDAAIVFFG